MRYPFTPELLDALPEELAELFRKLEITLLERICSQLKNAGEINEVSVQGIRALRSHGIDLPEIKKAISEAAGIGEKKLEKLLDDVVERNRQYYTELIDLAQVTAPEALVDAAADAGDLPQPYKYNGVCLRTRAKADRTDAGLPPGAGQRRLAGTERRRQLYAGHQQCCASTGAQRREDRCL